MVKKHIQFITTCLLAVDLLVVSIAWICAYYLRFYSSLIPVSKGIPPFSQYLNFILFVIIVWTVVFKAMYTHRLFQGRSPIDEFCDVLKLSTVAVLLLIAATFFYREHSYSRTLMVLFWMVSSSLLFISHSLFKKALVYCRKKGFKLRKVLIVGAGELGRTLADRIAKHPEIGAEVVGFLTDHPHKVGQVYNGVLVSAHIDELNRVVDEEKPDELFIALPLGAHKRLEKVINALDDETVDVKVVPDLFRFMRLNGGVEVFDGLPIINLSEGPLWGWNRVVKRLLDIVFSSCAIIVSSPLMLIIAILIKMTSRGPLLYQQERMGLDGKRFIINKFRSMVVGAEKETGAVWAKKDDTRTTSLGKWLRKTSIDELPQFFNVLKGEMSFVGPRPERPVFVETFKKSVPLYMLRHKMKAGLTGWAQVNGWRGNTSLEKRIEYDLYYIENWSLFFDLKIVWLTVWKGFINSNAY